MDRVLISLSVAVAVLLTVAAVGCRQWSEERQEVASWFTEQEFEIGDIMEGGAQFSDVTEVRIGPNGDRVFALEFWASRITAWSKDGEPAWEVAARGQGPGEVDGPLGLHFGADGVWVRDRQRYSCFSWDGSFLRTVPDPPSTLSYRGFRLRPEALLADDSFLTLPVVPQEIAAGWRGDDPVHELPVLWVRQVEGSWSADTVAVANVEHQHLSLRLADEPAVADIHTGQPFGDHDLLYYDSSTGSIVVARRTARDGTVELLEIAAAGDTTWRWDATLPAVPLGNRGDSLAAALTDAVVRRSGASRSKVRAVVDEALYLPDPLPPVRQMVSTASGEVWLRTFERSDTLVVWYAVRRGDAEAEPRRVLVPSSVAVHDATATHVWGVRTDSLGVNYLVGRRLIRAAAGTT